MKSKSNFVRICLLLIVMTVLKIDRANAQVEDGQVITTLTGVGDITQGMLNEIKSIKPEDGLAHSYTSDDLKMWSIEDRIISLKTAIISLKRLDNEVDSFLNDLWRIENYTLRD